MQERVSHVSSNGRVGSVGELHVPTVGPVNEGTIKRELAHGKLGEVVAKLSEEGKFVFVKGISHGKFELIVASSIAAAGIGYGLYRLTRRGKEKPGWKLTRTWTRGKRKK